MKNRKLNHFFKGALLVFLFAPFSFFSCEYGLQEAFQHSSTVNDRAEDLKVLLPPTVSANYSFLVISDVHFGKPEPDRYDNDFITKLSSISPAPDFCICLGDVADHGKKSELKDYNADLVAKIESITGGKVYTILGNHDLYNSGWDEWKDLVYPYTSFYTFTINNNLSFYFLDSASGSLGINQFKSLKNAMKADPLPKVVSMHYPVYGSCNFMDDYYALQNEKESTQLLSLFATQNVSLILAGHVHKDKHNYFSRTTEEYVLPSYHSNKQFAIITVSNNSITNKVLISY